MSTRRERGLAPTYSGEFNAFEIRQPQAGLDFPRDEQQFEEWVRSEASCAQFLERVRWPNGFSCPHCGDCDEPWRNGLTVACYTCRRPVILTQDSLFCGLETPLKSWLCLLWQACSSESTLDEQTVCKIVSKTDARQARARIEKVARAMAVPARRRLHGAIDVVLTSIEVQTGTGQRRAVHEVNLLVAIQRGDSYAPDGRVRLGHLRELSPEAVVGFLRDATCAGSEIYTDGWHGFRDLKDIGSTHWISPKPTESLRIAEATSERVASMFELWTWSRDGINLNELQRCVDEFGFRYNARKHCVGRSFYDLVVASLLFWQRQQPASHLSVAS